MGASEFFHTGKGKTMKEAFSNAREEALYDHGHSGYSGTLAEKHDCVLIKEAKVKDRKEAYELAQKLISDGDDRIDDKWGPAGAIKVSDNEWLFFGWASS